MYNGSAWVTAAAAPTSANGVITIQSGHTMQITATVSIDQVVINYGGTINWTGGTLTIADGTGVDLQVDGTFWDNRGATTPSITFSPATATWQMGANGTLLRSAGNSSNNWQSNYQGGISSIPATAFWILRKTTGQNPALSTTTPSTGSYYPNLVIENNTSNAYSVSFSGSTTTANIKGYFDIGGSGSGTGAITSGSTNTYTNPVSVASNLIVRTNHILQNYGTGFQVGGDIKINGTVSYDANDARKLILNGTILQDISGVGTMGIYDLTINNSSGSVTLSRAITVDNLMTFVNGIVYSTATNLLTLNTNASVSGANNASFVSGPVRYKGPNALTFPVGKGSDYQAIGISAGTPDNTFWTETFSNSCSANCILPYTGPNGTWTNTDPTANAANCNRWYISGKECGNAAGSCGSTCAGTDPSLHIGANDGFVTDQGASYDAGGLCPSFACVTTDHRAESPTIDCSPYSNMVLSFNYIENGSGAVDNATLWYFDGTTWSQLADMPKSVLCGGQGTWTNYSIALPVSANNNPSVKIGFRWVNNDDGVGTDPSFAVDDITLTQPGPVSDFTAEYFYSNPQVPYGNTLASPLTTLSSCEYWILTRNTGTENKYVTLNWDANSCPVTSLTTLRVARYDGISTWQNEGNVSTTGSISAGTITSGLVTSFSPFTLADITILPIELLDFQANYDGTNVNCTWATATELNNDYFTVERSVDGVNFIGIGKVKGAGTTNVQLDYAFTDDQPVTGQSYYRLKQTDFDGAYTYGPTRPVTIGTGTNVHIDFIVQDNTQLKFNYTFSGGNATLMIHDMTGKLVYTTMLSESKSLVLDKSNWSKGIYTVLLTDGKQADHRKFVIE
jgi:hypothetical protein